MPEADALSNFDITRPHIARIYDYWLGGKDNFEVDREAAELALAATPTIVHCVPDKDDRARSSPT